MADTLLHFQPFSANGKGKVRYPLSATTVKWGDFGLRCDFRQAVSCSLLKNKKHY